MKTSEKIMLVCIFIMLIVMMIIIIAMMKTRHNSENISTGNTTMAINNVEEPEETVNEEKKMSENIEVVPTMEDKITEDSVWCPTFQLVWNDMKNELVKQDVRFTDEKDEPEYLKNLNAETFKEKDISDSYYYKKWGMKSNDLKDEILKGIKDKFDETSDIIKPDEDWGEPSEENFIFYTMLKKIFNFESPFDVLKEGGFTVGDKVYTKVKYFGIDENSDKKLKDQLTILYYEDNKNYAVSIATKENDEVIVAKGVKGTNFAEMYKNINESSKKYEGDTKMIDGDLLKIPNLNLNVLKEYKEIENKDFVSKDEKTYKIERALQTLKFELDNEGGKIKSEAIIDVKTNSVEVDVVPPKYLYFDSEFVLFVKEKDKDLPYFAVNVSDISKYQSEVEKPE